ncbi:hypothetical protein ABEB36_009864, partial [Hypothenemus hampei]
MCFLFLILPREKESFRQKKNCKTLSGCQIVKSFLTNKTDPARTMVLFRFVTFCIQGVLVSRVFLTSLKMLSFYSLAALYVGNYMVRTGSLKIYLNTLYVFVG